MDTCLKYQKNEDVQRRSGKRVRRRWVFEVHCQKTRCRIPYQDTGKKNEPCFYHPAREAIEQSSVRCNPPDIAQNSLIIHRIITTIRPETQKDVIRRVNIMKRSKKTPPCHAYSRISFIANRLRKKSEPNFRPSRPYIANISILFMDHQNLFQPPCRYSRTYNIYITCLLYASSHPPADPINTPQHSSYRS